MNCVDMAVDFYKAAGGEIAFAEFTNPEGRFVDGDMYIYALDMKGTMLAHGANEGFVGEEWIDVKDSGGKPFVKEILEIAETERQRLGGIQMVRPGSQRDAAQSGVF